MTVLTLELDEQLSRFVQHQAAEKKATPTQVAAEILRAGFELRLQELYKRYIQGEFSFGRLASEMGMTTWELTHLLEERGWATHNLPAR
jgi:hypothetical protein